MDALSSMANIAGYRAVIESANNFGRFVDFSFLNNNLFVQVCYSEIFAKKEDYCHL